MKRADVDYVKAEIRRLLDRIDQLERCAGWSRYTESGNLATSKTHPHDTFNCGRYTAAVRRSRLDLLHALRLIK